MGLRSIPACAGEPNEYQYCSQPLGSIPACAGEPLLCVCRQRHMRVYPRVCGGTIIELRGRL